VRVWRVQATVERERESFILLKTALSVFHFPLRDSELIKQIWSATVCKNTFYWLY